MCVCVCVCWLTVGVQEGGVQLSGQQRIRHVSEELFEQRRHVMDAVLLVQLDVHAHVEVLHQLRNKHTHIHRNTPRGQRGVSLPRWTRFLQNRTSHIISSLLEDYFYIPLNTCPQSVDLNLSPPK